jgi:cytochrome c
MYKRNMLSPAGAIGLVLALAVALTTAVTGAQEGPGLGIAATADEIEAWSLTVLPNGEGLPPGSGTARAGEGIYAEKCLACHGAEGKDGPSDRLAGGHGTLQDAAPVKTVGSYWPYATTVFDYIRRAMPFTQPQSLSANETYALTAYLLFLNDIVERDEVIDAGTLPAIEMPNEGNFYWAYAEGSSAR